MKKLRQLTIALLATAALSTNAMATPTDTGTILGVGDSITAGEGVKDGKQAKWGYVASLRKQLADDDGLGYHGEPANMAVMNIAVPGYRTSQVLAQLGNPATQYAIATADVRIITLSVGGNDLRDALDAGLLNACFVPGYEVYCQQAVGAVYGDIGGRLGTIVGTLRALAPTADIVLVGMYNPFHREGCDPSGILAPAADGLLYAWNQSVVGPTAAYFGGYFVDPLGAFIAADQLFLADINLRLDDGVTQLDCLHPSRQGHNYIAAEIVAAITAP